MNETIQGALILMKSAITGEPEQLPDQFNAGPVINMMSRQGVLSMGYLGALNCGVSPDHPGMVRILDQYCIDVITSERQLKHIDRICKAFEENGIEYMPVKGTLLKHMYPNHELRRMSDADILIREEKYSQIIPVMQQLGFREAGESDHEHIWENEHLKVELHKHLIPSYNKDLYSYFGTGWDLAKIQKGCRWEMTQEDAYIYNFIHFAKHYRDSDVHCRFVVDLWVHQRQCPELDMQYIRQRLRDMKMEIFFDNIMKVIDCWFADGQWDDRTDLITRVLFHVDIEDKMHQYEVAQSTRKATQSGSVKQVRQASRIRRIFPDRENMDFSYPQWKKKPLPIAWCLRWGDLAFHRRDVVKNRMGDKNRVSEQEVENYRQDLEYVGLQFSDGVALPD